MQRGLEAINVLIVGGVAEDKYQVVKVKVGAVAQGIHKTVIGDAISQGDDFWIGV